MSKSNKNKKNNSMVDTHNHAEKYISRDMFIKRAFQIRSGLIYILDGKNLRLCRQMCNYSQTFWNRVVVVEHNADVFEYQQKVMLNNAWNIKHILGDFISVLNSASNVSGIWYDGQDADINRSLKVIDIAKRVSLTNAVISVTIASRCRSGDTKESRTLASRANVLKSHISKTFVKGQMEFCYPYHRNTICDDDGVVLNQSRTANASQMAFIQFLVGSKWEEVATSYHIHSIKKITDTHVTIRWWGYPSDSNPILLDEFFTNNPNYTLEILCSWV
jgi:hypothetical protein